jgi:vacuolar-type H+-ATPase subunit H
MAGETVIKIREKEKEASELVNNARLDAKRIVQNARDEKTVFFDEKDAALKREEAGIRDQFLRESEGIIRDLQGQEEKEIERINEMCGKSLKKVVAFISKEIVKE